MFFNQRPYGWRDDSRTHKLMQVQGCKQPAADLFPSLGALAKEAEKSPANPISTLSGSALFQKMLGAKGGDSLDILQEL